MHTLKVPCRGMCSAQVVHSRPSVFLGVETPWQLLQAALVLPLYLTSWPTASTRALNFWALPCLRTLTATWLATACALVRMRREPSGAITKPVAVHLVCCRTREQARQQGGEGRCQGLHGGLYSCKAAGTTNTGWLAAGGVCENSAPKEPLQQGYGCRKAPPTWCICHGWLKLGLQGATQEGDSTEAGGGWSACVRANPSVDAASICWWLLR